MAPLSVQYTISQVCVCVCQKSGAHAFGSVRDTRDTHGGENVDTPIGQFLLIGNFCRRLARELLVLRNSPGYCKTIHDNSMLLSYLLGFTGFPSIYALYVQAVLVNYCNLYRRHLSHCGRFPRTFLVICMPGLGWP